MVIKISCTRSESGPRLQRRQGLDVLKNRSTVFACGYFVAVLLADLLTSPQHSFTSLFALIPVLLALDWGPVVVAVGAAPLLVLTVTNVFGKDQSSTTGTAIRSVGVLVGAGIGAYIAAYREDHASALNFSRAAALAAQDAILPVVPSSVLQGHQHRCRPQAHCG
jgi:hypothetical protein